ncbi:MAG: tetratricopeptide repeat protein, partial [Bacteroidota bacterium]|nr:tetratricopeptide repeat protein [Bacteroidota bacterium]
FSLSQIQGSEVTPKKNLSVRYIDSLLIVGQSMDSGPVRMQVVSKRALALAKTIGYKRGIFHACYNISLSDFYQSQYFSSYKILDSLLVSLQKDSLGLSKAFNYPLIKSKIYCLMAIIFDETGDYEKALNNYLIALKLIERSDDKYDIALIYKGIGIINMEIGEFKKADQYFDLAFRICKGFKDKRIQFDIYSEKLKYYLKKEDYANAQTYCFKQLELCGSSQNLYMNVITEKNLGLIYFKQGKYSLAEAYLKETLAMDRKNQFPDVISETYALLSKIYLNNKDLGKAKSAADQAYNFSLKTDLLPLKADALQCFAEIFDKSGEYKKSLMYFHEYHDLEDSIYEKNNRQKIIEMQFRYDMDKILKEKKILTDQLTINDLKNSRKSYILYGAFTCILLLVYLSFVLMKRYKFEKVSNDNLQKKQSIIEEQRKIILREQEERFKIELEHKNRELVSYTMALTRENENKIKIVNDLLHLKEITGKNKTSFSDEIYRMAREIRQTINEAPWEEFKLYFENVHSDFSKKLEEQFPDLTRNEKKLCAFLKLNLGTKEIATITCREIRSVESSRARLRKKFKLPPEISLTEFLSRF